MTGAEPNPLAGRWIELKDRAIFRITGRDRVRYLNGQVSNDVAGPLQEKAIAACLCSLKGKVEFLVWISAGEDCLFVDGQLNQREALFERLDRYLIADDCEIEDVTDDWSLVHHFTDPGDGIPSRRTAWVGYDLYLQAEFPFAKETEIDADVFAESQWRALIPAFPWEITGNEFPAELGIADWTVDFHKGCYLGQEVISRIKSVGKVKRGLILASAETPFERDSIVRTEEGFTGRVTRPLHGGDEKKFYGFCLVNTVLKNTQPVAVERVVKFIDGN